MKADLLKTEERQLLFQLGMVAIRNAMPWEAFRLFGRLLSSPEQTRAYPRIGLAYCLIVTGEVEEAIGLLDSEEVVQSPLAADALALKAMASLFAKNGKQLDAVLEKAEATVPSGSSADALLQAVRSNRSYLTASD